MKIVGPKLGVLAARLGASFKGVDNEVQQGVTLLAVLERQADLITELQNEVRILKRRTRDIPLQPMEE